MIQLSPSRSKPNHMVIVTLNRSYIWNIFFQGTRKVSGISFDVSRIGEVSLSETSFKRMRHLQFLSVFRTGYDGRDRVHIPENMEFPPRLRLLEWKAYPRKNLSPTLNLEHLVELNMECSRLLEKLWEGAQVSYHNNLLLTEICYRIRFENSTCITLYIVSMF